MRADSVQVGEFVEGFGRIDRITVNHQDRAIKGITTALGIKILPKQKFNSLVRARLAEEAVEQCYESVPVSVTFTSGQSRRTFNLSDHVEVETRRLSKAA